MKNSIVTLDTTSSTIGENSLILSTTMSETTIVNWCKVKDCQEMPDLIDEADVTANGATGKKYTSSITALKESEPGFEGKFPFIWPYPEDIK
mmetsp:Transcript_32414/g.49581  ORF Transcript_32414/g.49581 Transcript_32414/m.49581 type:complete len:92 (+) Transcript_32414:134-409(+)|eukprot:CAMPEP_0170497456 /NCGR_PEP_ID=MMETSP0208-20121228/24847_1 /TAXON_ID=197538 /ORGANISM="Strombidium inclinatum, Strain S3" /LENGTH=91 /DNA_ID=CAMNT_0010774279 /DNA_START=69 /DNA_END=344 /DNA_ORIENTATION=+